MSMLIIQIAAFVGIASLVGGIALIMTGASETGVEDRLAILTGSTSGKQAKDALLKASVLSRPLESRQHLIAEKIAKLFNINLLLDQADTTLKPSHLLGISLGLALLGAVVAIVTQIPLYFVPVTALTLAVVPLIWLLLRRRKRFRDFAKQLPDALELISRALRAGHSLASGFSLVSEEMRAPIGKEFQRVFEEQNLGVALEDALDGMTERIPNLDLRFFATAVILQRQTGGDLAEILDKIGYLVRERFKIWGTVQALTGEGRLSGIVLLALPPVLFLAVYRLNPDYVLPLFTDPLGRKMLVGAIVMQLLGAIVIKKIISIKV